MMESLNTYNYVEQMCLKPKNYEVTISDLDKVIKIMEDGSLLAELGLDLSNGWLTLTGKEGLDIASVELPGSQVLKGGVYDKTTQEIVLSIINADSSESEIRIDVADLVDVYQNGNGIEIDNEKRISIKINENSASILDATENGLGIDLSSYSTFNDLNNEKLAREAADVLLSQEITDKVGVESFLREEADNELNAKKVPWTSIGTDGRKSIVLANNDLLLGADTTGGTYNLAMVSKWNIADFGSDKIKMNLNSSEKISVNDEDALAYMSDLSNVDSALEDEIIEREANDVILKNMIIEETKRAIAKEDSIVTEINTEKERAISKEDSIVTEINTERERAIFKEDSIVAELIEEKNRAIAKEDSIVVEIKTEVNAEKERAIAKEDSIVEQLVFDVNAEKERAIIKEDSIVVEINSERERAIFKEDSIVADVIARDILLQEQIDKNISDIAIVNDTITNEIKPSVEKIEKEKVPFTFELKDGVEIKNIVLDNEASLLGKSNGGKNYNIATVSKYNKIEIGSSTMPMNLRSNERITVNNNEELAYVSELSGSSSDLAAKISANTASIIANKVILDEEILRATNAENKIETEYKAADIVLEDGLVDEIARATAKETILQEGIDGEITRATSKEDELKSEIDTKVAWTKIATDRKGILLVNNDILMGKATDGNISPLIFMNQWDVVDAGSTSFKFNINTPSGVRPTIQEANVSGENAEKMAYLSDIDKISDEKVSTVELVQDVDNKLRYILYVDGVVKGDINIPKDQFLKEARYDADTKELIFVFITSEGENEVRIDMSNLIDVYTAGNGLKLQNNEFSVDTEIVATKEYVNEANTKLQANIDTEIARATTKENELTNNKVSWSKVGDDGRKSVVLANNDLLLGTDTNGSTYNLAMVSKWNVADFGSSTIPFNINSSVIPTVQSGDVTKHIALTEDIEIAYKEADAKLQDNIDTEIARATTKENETLVESKAYTDEKVAHVTDNIEMMIDNKVDPIYSKFNDYLTKDEIIDELNNNLKISKDYTDEEIAQELGKLEINIDNKISSAITDAKTDINVNIIKNTNNILKLSTGLNSDIYSGGTGIVDDVYKITHDLIYDLDEATLKGYLKRNVNTIKGDKGISIENNKASIVIDPTSENYLTVSTNGLKLSGLNNVIDATNTELNEEIIRAKNIEGKLRSDVDYESARALNAEANINLSLNSKVTWAENNSKIVLPSGGQLVGTQFGDNPLEGATIAQLSKYNIMDFGSVKYPLNLNVPDGVRPTVQEKSQSGVDANKIAYVSDITTISNNLTSETIARVEEDTIINAKITSIEVLKDSVDGNKYTLMVDGIAKGEINIPKDQFLKDAKYDADTKKLIFTFITTEGETITEIDMSTLIDVYTASNGIKLANNDFSIDTEIVATKEYVNEANTKLQANIDAEETRAISIESGLKVDTDKLRVDVNYESTRALEAESNINKSLDTKVTWAENNTKIILPSGGQLVGTKFGDDPLDGATIAQLNEWGIMDFGSSKYSLNLNVPDGVRPTVQEKSQSGADANKIAYVSDVETSKVELNGAIGGETARAIGSENTLKADIEILETKLINNIDVEVTRATAIEGELRTDIEGEVIRAKTIEDKLRVDVDYESSRALEAEANINKALDTKVTWDTSSTKIVIPSGGSLVGTEFGVDPLKGGTIAQLNEWGVMDFGSPKYKLNLNVPAGVRPTVQEQGQSGAEAKEIAYKDDIIKAKEDIATMYVTKADYDALLARVIALEKPII